MINALSGWHVLEEAEIPISRALHGASVVGERLLITDVDTHVMTVMISAVPLLEKERPWGVVSLWHDISARECLREEAEHKAVELDATLNSIADGVILYADTGEILHTDPASSCCHIR